MARAVDSATAVAFLAGESGSGGIKGRGILRRDGSGTGSICAGVFGKPRSTPAVAYVSTWTFPACAVLRTYLPRSNPATGRGRSETQRPTCAPSAFRLEISAGVAAAFDTGAGLPVATSVQPGG